MENLTVLHTPQPVKGNPSGLVIAASINYLQNDGAELIIGLESIDRIIVELCPEIRTMSGEDMEILKFVISAYWFEGRDVLNVIRQRTNRDTVDFIEGIGLLINEAGLESPDALRHYMDENVQAFNPIRVCALD